jgi:hypothetical protein
MNGEGVGGDDGAVKMEAEIEKLVYMWGYLPGALPQRSPLVSPMAVRVPETIGAVGDSWKDVCGGGCGFAMAISGAFFNLCCQAFSFFFPLLLKI